MRDKEAEISGRGPHGPGSRRWIYPVTSQSNSIRNAAMCCSTGGESSLQVLDERGHVEGLHGRQLADAATFAPFGEAAHGVPIRLARVVVVDLRPEKFQDALRGLGCRRKERCLEHWRAGMISLELVIVG